MPCAIFAGIHRNTVARLKPKLEAIKQIRPTWEFRFAPCNTSEGLSREILDEVLRMAADRGGAHIFGMSASDDRGRDRGPLAAQLREAFRFRWMPDELPALIAGPEKPLIDLLAAILDDEDYWRDNLMPSSCHDALILPSNFPAHHQVAGLWQLSESFNNRPMLEKAVRLLPQFIQAHRQVKGNAKAWRDADSHVWDDYGAHHGNPKFPHGWKYSYFLADKFHFDLTAEHNRAFTYRCPNQQKYPCKAGGHINVNAHGYVC